MILAILNQRGVAATARSSRRVRSVGSSAPVDLRSDTVTKPSPAMVAAMAAASVGDDVFGGENILSSFSDARGVFIEMVS